MYPKQSHDMSHDKPLQLLEIIDDKYTDTLYNYYIIMVEHCWLLNNEVWEHTLVKRFNVKETEKQREEKQEKLNRQRLRL